MAAILAGVAAHRDGESARAQSMLAAGAEQTEAVGAVQYAAAARRFRAQLLPGDTRALELATADAWFTQREVKNPALFAAALVPGFSL